jgi:UDP-N-acetylmuramoyl-L-alanyl-D-glutamate--2,6-diaminopimelate ligase
MMDGTRDQVIRYSGSGRWEVGPGVTGVAIDSRRVEPGHVFVAIPGARADGHRFIPDAVARGAVAVVAERPVSDCAVPCVMVRSARQAAAELAAAVYRYPGQTLKVTGVTGTNGKTSVVFWVRHLLTRNGYPTGMLSSVFNWTGDGPETASLTTPEAPDVQRALARMRDHGLTHAALEVSSHGLVQHRVDGIPFRAAVLTNITREHLDYHGSMAQYIDAKSILFTRLLDSDGVAVFNADDPYSQDVSRRFRGRSMSFGMARGDVRARILREEAWRTDVRISSDEGQWDVSLPVPGRYNVYNVLAAAGAAMANGIRLEHIVPHLSDVPQVPGRLEVAAQGDGVVVLVDYAHTPDGLSQVLQTVRRLTVPSARVWLVFGARGGRDRGKRPIMGAVAARLADAVILTADSPNQEDVETIIDELAQGMYEAGRRPYAIEPDRQRAIHLAVADAAPGDVVLITGRGPEQFQTFGAERRRMVDREAARAAMADRVRGKETAPHVTAGDRYHPYV